MGFSFKKKEETSAEEQDDQTIPATPSPKRSRRFETEDDDNSDSDLTEQPPKSPSKKKSSRKKSSSTKAAIDDASTTPELTKSNNTASRGSSSFCTCKRLVCSSICLLLSMTIGIIVWRYGPWSKDSATVQSLEIILADGDSCQNGACCNGLSSNCNLPVNEVLFSMVHHAHSSYENNFVGASNNRPLEEALVAGYRALQLSTCMCEGFLSGMLLEQDEDWGLGESNLGFCHTACGAGVRDPKDVLTNLKTFIETNTREVVIIEFDMNEGSSADLRTTLQYSGLLDYVYHPQDEYYIEEWPTMQQLIDDNTRILLFASGDGMRSCPAYDCTDGILYTNDHFSQTETDGSDLDLCQATISGDVYVGYFKMNHFEKNKVKMPSPSKARELNSYINLEERFESCQGRSSPNLLAVEFWDEGDVLEYVKNENAGKNRVGGEFMMATPEEEAAAAYDNDNANEAEGGGEEGAVGSGRRLRG